MPRNELHPRTALINKKQKILSKLARQQALAWLAAHFPAVFDTTLSIQPLKKGIMHDILQYASEKADPSISFSKIREAVVAFTRRIDYLTCLKNREMRVDLNNHPVELVTEEEAEKAASTIKKMVEKSARNARREAREKSQSPYPVMRPVAHRSATPHAYNAAIAVHNNKPAIYSTANTTAPKSAVTITHKSTRTFDSEALTRARLKSKLGLAKED